MLFCKSAKRFGPYRGRWLGEGLVINVTDATDLAP
jgi:hypothetical protein